MDKKGLDAEWRRFKAGENWRSDRIYRCEVCHIQTNKWTMGRGMRIICPGTQYYEHENLEVEVDILKGIEEKIRKYSKIIKDSDIKDDKINNFLENLNAEKKLLIIYVNQIRNLFVGLNDIKGLDENSPIENFYPYVKFNRKEHLIKE